jgi:hypothetical protein
VARARQDAGLSKMALAERIGVRLFVIDRYEAGSPIPPDHLVAIAEATGHSVGWLRGEMSVDPQFVPPATSPSQAAAFAASARSAAATPAIREPDRPRADCGTSSCSQAGSIRTQRRAAPLVGWQSADF